MSPLRKPRSDPLHTEVADAYSLARQHGYDNVITGEFAEFVFGNPIHVVSHHLSRGNWRALARFLAAERRRGTSVRKLAGQVSETFVPAGWLTGTCGSGALIRRKGSLSGSMRER